MVNMLGKNFSSQVLAAFHCKLIVSQQRPHVAKQITVLRRFHITVACIRRDRRRHRNLAVVALAVFPSCNLDLQADQDSRWKDCCDHHLGSAAGALAGAIV